VVVLVVNAVFLTSSAGFQARRRGGARVGGAELGV
jgi:hypothetical protein